MGAYRKKELLFGCGKVTKQSNFFKAFTTSSTIPSIYIQQFCDTVRYDKTARCYKCQLDEQWFDLTKDTLRDALQITPINNNQAFTSPPSFDALINFVNELGYPKLVRNLSNVITNDMFQPWRALTKIINMKHKFYPRPDSPLHLANEEPVLGYLKFSAKGTKREVFGMPIPGNLITADIQGESYYQDYLAKVAKHQRYLAGETGSDPDSPAPKPTKTAKKSKPTMPKAYPRPPVSKPVPCLVSKRRKPISSQRSVDESVAEDIPEKEPRFDDEEADVQRVLEESLKSIYDVPRGLLPLVVIWEPESGKYQPLPEVSRKGKEKAGPNPDAQDEGHAGPNPDEKAKGQARPKPGDAEASQPLPSLVFHAGSDLEHMDLDVADVSTQPHPEQMDEGFTATTYPKVQENLKLTVEEQVILEELASSSGTLSSLQHLTKDLSFGDLFNDKPSKANNDKVTAETEAESLVSVTI
nr:E-beta-farnesene synthase [Tanacetum cinerariifolium]